VAIILDLDQTLVDSRCSLDLRSRRRWQAVYGLIPQCRPYSGITELLVELRELGIPVCIVTSSPEPYCRKVVQQWSWIVDAIVCYHDTRRHKPDPDPIILALSRLGAAASNTIAVGDDARDIVAAKRAGVIAAGALWGCSDRQALIAAQPHFLAETVADLREFLLRQHQ
jgi:HAD superfamily hydrolase (TIGR01509 family)